MLCSLSSDDMLQAAMYVALPGRVDGTADGWCEIPRDVIAVGFALEAMLDSWLGMSEGGKLSPLLYPFADGALDNINGIAVNEDSFDKTDGIPDDTWEDKDA
jgi:hypothetical protein